MLCSDFLAVACATVKVGIKTRFSRTHRPLSDPPAPQCSHVLAINHILEHIDVNYLLGKVQKAKKIGGYKRNVRPALQCESDSSDDDAPNLLQT